MKKERKKEIIIIEDGDEYEAFANLFLSDRCNIRAFRSASAALNGLAKTPADGFLLDLRFDRSPETELAGDPEKTAQRLFAGDREAGMRYLREHQGTFALAALRQAGYYARALFVHDFPKGRLENLRRLYGDVQAVTSFDAASIRAAFGVGS
jgi:hypothetical protein